MIVALAVVVAAVVFAVGVAVGIMLQQHAPPTPAGGELVFKIGPVEDQR